MVSRQRYSCIHGDCNQLEDPRKSPSKLRHTENVMILILLISTSSTCFLKRWQQLISVVSVCALVLILIHQQNLTLLWFMVFINRRRKDGGESVNGGGAVPNTSTPPVSTRVSISIRSTVNKRHYFHIFHCTNKSVQRPSVSRILYLWLCISGCLFLVGWAADPVQKTWAEHKWMFFHSGYSDTPLYDHILGLEKEEPGVLIRFLKTGI